MPRRYDRSERLAQALRVKEPVQCFHYQVDGQTMSLKELGKYLGEWLMGLAKERETREETTNASN